MGITYYYQQFIGRFTSKVYYISRVKYNSRETLSPAPGNTKDEIISNKQKMHVNKNELLKEKHINNFQHTIINHRNLDDKSRSL